MKRKNNFFIRLVSIVAVIALFGATLLSTTRIFSNSDIAHAEGLSSADSLLLKILKQDMEICFGNGIIRDKDINASNHYEATDIFLTESLKYKDDGAVMLPFKYGAGNTV